MCSIVLAVTMKIEIKYESLFIVITQTNIISKNALRAYMEECKMSISETVVNL